MSQQAPLRKRQSKRQESLVDWPLVTITAILMIFSLITIFSTTYLQFSGTESGATIMPTIMQGLWYVGGWVLAIAIMQVPTKRLWDAVPYLYFGGILLLILVLIFYDRSLFLTQGAKSWFRVGPFSLQPSELTKITFILMNARVITDHNEKTENRNVKTDFILLGKMLLWSVPMMFLVLIQNDLGSTIVYGFILIGMIFISGISWKILLPAFLTVAIIGGILIFLVVYDRQLLLNLGFRNYQFGRIDSWLNPFENTQNEGYQLSQTIKAIGSGKLAGKGLGIFEVYVPVRESDMVFATIGENFGFLGSSLLILVFFLLISQSVTIASKSKNPFYATMVVGIVTMWAFHIFENIGMAIGLVPLTGIPLPFISQGGSSLLTNMIAVGLILSIRLNTSLKRYNEGESTNDDSVLRYSKVHDMFKSEKVSRNKGR